MISTRKRFSPIRLTTTAAAFAALFAVGAGAAMAQTDAAKPAKGAADANQTPAPQPSAAAVPQPDWEKVCGQVNKQQECHISRKRLAATGQAIAQFMIIER